MNSPAPLLAFTHIAKTAGMSLHHVLRRTYGTGYVVISNIGSEAGRRFGPEDLRRLRKRYRGLKAVGGHTVLPHGDLVDEFPETRFLTMLRDPVKRCVSHYAYGVHRGAFGKPITEWIRDETWHDYQTRKLAGVADAARAREILENRVAFVGLVERFDESLRMLASLLPEAAPPPAPVHRNRSPVQDLRDELLADPAVVDMIWSVHREDQRVYEYVRDVVWPRQQEAVSGAAPPGGSEARAVLRQKMSVAKERFVFGIPRRLHKAGLKAREPL